MWYNFLMKKIAIYMILATLLSIFSFKGAYLQSGKPFYNKVYTSCANKIPLTLTGCQQNQQALLSQNVHEISLLVFLGIIIFIYIGYSSSVLIHKPYKPPRF